MKICNEIMRGERAELSKKNPYYISKHLPEFVEKYEKMFHQPRKFVTYTDSEGKAHLDVDYCTPEK